MIINKVFIALIFIMLSTILSYAETITSSGSAIIEKGDLRTAYKNSLNNAITGAIKNYYKQLAKESNIEQPDVTAEYIKFVKDYKILSRKVSGYTVTTKVSANIDGLALQDAGVLISNPLDTAVFSFAGIPIKTLSNEQQFTIINKALTSQNFSTQEQKNFAYSLSGATESKVVRNEFKSIDSRYLFLFNFKFKTEKMENPDSSCELSTSTDIVSRDGSVKSLKIETNSVKTNEQLCLTESMTKAVVTTIDYVRQNLIQTPVKENELYQFQIKAINFNNLVGPNRFISTLKQRGFITKFKATSFSQKEIIFEIESYFSESALTAKLWAVPADMPFTFSTYSKGIVLDFKPKTALEIPQE